MNAISKTLKISSRGQITLPKAVRDRLGEQLVVIVADRKGVRIEPLKSAAGSLRQYAKNGPKNLSWKEERELAWDRELADEWKPSGTRRQRRLALPGR